MKKLILFLLVISIAIFTFVACGTPATPEDNPSEAPSTPEENPPETKNYTVKWYDENGNLLSSVSLAEGTTPSYNYTPNSDAEWLRTLAGWSTTSGGSVVTIEKLAADVSYYAVVNSQKQKYTVNFVTGFDTSIDAVTVEYGELVNEPEIERDGFRLIGWFSDSSKTVSVDWTKAIVINNTYYAAWVEVINVKALFNALLDGYAANPYEYIPESMRPDYSANLVDQSAAAPNYSSFVNVRDIATGFGEQWNMVIENIEESAVFFNALAVVESLTSVSVSAFNNYFDQNPGDTAHHTFASGIYNVTISFDGTEIYYVLDYTAEFPLVGTQTAEIMLSMNIETAERTVRVQLGDVNALKYTIGENYYEFAIKYLGVRRAYFSVVDNDGVIEGHIYEYLTAAGVETGSAADFYITDGYVSAVGNKASGLLGFDNYIVEVYDADNGKLLGYEVREESAIVSYDTLWFNLESLSGINSIKYIPATETTDAAIYVNGSSTAWKNDTVGGWNPLTSSSRRYDIEFRTQYVYSYDDANDKYIKTKVSVPMLFVQEDYLDTLSDDISKKNSGVNASVNVSTVDLNKIMSDYETLVDVFIGNKEIVTVDVILAFIGNKETV